MARFAVGDRVRSRKPEFGINDREVYGVTISVEHGETLQFSAEGDWFTADWFEHVTPPEPAEPAAPPPNATAG